jgi:hypothetical protein
MPRPRHSGIHRTDRTGSFAGIVYEWWKLGLCEIHENPTPWFWFNQVGDTLLYYRPTLETMPPVANYRLGLFANCSPPVNGRINVPWTFWPSVPSRAELYRHTAQRSYEKRDAGFVFAGSWENLKQRSYRPMEWWRPALDTCHYGNAKKLTNKEYLRLLGRSRFGLVLPGYGPKCWREMEYLAMGVVPIYTPGCSLEFYNPMVCGTHYLYARTPEEARTLIESTSPEQWQILSDNGKAWYERHCSPLGSFVTTVEIIEQNTPNALRL